MPTTDYPPEMPIVKIRLIRDDNNKIIGLINSDGRKFNRFNDLMKKSMDGKLNDLSKTYLNNNIENLKEYSVEDLEKRLNIKKMQNKLNNMPKIHSKMSNYELYLELGSNESAFNIIKNGTYWADKAFQLKSSQLDYDTVMKSSLSERENKFFSFKNNYNIKNNLNKQNKIENKEETTEDDNTVLCSNNQKENFATDKQIVGKQIFVNVPKLKNYVNKIWQKK